MRPPRLSVAQRSGIREIADGEGKVPAQTLAVLKRCGFVVDRSDKGLRLTTKGRQAYEAIMSSGDGPEALKELFRLS